MFALRRLCRMRHLRAEICSGPSRSHPYSHRKSARRRRDNFGCGGSRNISATKSDRISDGDDFREIAPARLRKFARGVFLPFPPLWLTVIFLVFSRIGTSSAINCYECGSMYDGTNFMGIKGFQQCQFFESDVATDKAQGQFMKECPQEDSCCFSLREYMDIDFWGHSAAAEVFVHGCCSSLNATSRFHHLRPQTASPPALATSDKFRAEILSQTEQNEHIKTRVLFCNSLGCNSKRIPWSKPVKVFQEEEEEEPPPAPTPAMVTTAKSEFLVPDNNERLVVEAEDIEDFEDSDFRRRSRIERQERRRKERTRLTRLRTRLRDGGEVEDLLLAGGRRREFDLNSGLPEDVNVIDLLELSSPPSGTRRPLSKVDFPDAALDPEENRRRVGQRITPGTKKRERGGDDDGRRTNGRLLSETPRTADQETALIANRLSDHLLQSSSSSPNFKSRSPVCECHCNCPALVCPPTSSSSSSRQQRSNGASKMDKLEMLIISMAILNMLAN